MMNTIRFSSQAWVIPLVRDHECTTCDPVRALCQHKCPKTDTVESARIRIADFDLTNNSIFYLDDVVIRDHEYTIRIDKPLTTPAFIAIKKGERTTLRELLWIISRLYHTIYEVEANTATAIHLPMEKQCIECDHAPLMIHDIEGVDEMCSICYSSLETNVIQTTCSHAFHKECIDQWLQVSSSPTCPLCRGNLKHCDTCDGTHRINQSETFTEIPIEIAYYLSGGVRNTTDGVYGIHTYFLSQLIVNGIQYDRITRTVSMSVTY